MTNLNLESKIILTKEANGIWVLAVNNTPANLLTKSVVQSMSAALDSFESDKTAMVLIITGTGDKFFVGGVSLDEIEGIQSPADGKKMSKLGQDLCSRIESSDKPILCAINGYCVGGGNEISIACHIRIASDNAVFQQPETHLGIIPGFGGTQRLPRLIGPGNARKLILAGDKLKAIEALQIGLVDEVVSRGNALMRTKNIAEMMVSKSPLAIICANRAINAAAGPVKEGIDFESEQFYEVCKTEDMKEALKAFKDKRPPRFKGR